MVGSISQSPMWMHPLTFTGSPVAYWDRALGSPVAYWDRVLGSPVA